MNITFQDTHEFSKKELERLFLSVEWSSLTTSDTSTPSCRKMESICSRMNFSPL